MTPAQRDALIDITNCGSVEEIWDMLISSMARYGFDRLIYGFTRFRTGQSLGDPKDFHLLSNHSRAYTEAYIGQGLYYRAPMLRWVLENDGACSWQMLASDTRLTPDEQKIIDFNATMGVTAGYTISFRSVSSRAKGAIALTGRAGITQAELDAVWAEHGSDIVLLNNVAHLKILTLPFIPPNQELTKRQREALEWVSDGKTTHDIAERMGVSRATVEKHLRLARAVLKVDTTAQAVTKASFQNQMFLIDPES
ncbi:MAG: helix-turn-helix transcriptional regulator [Primorskyibacter sp.]